MQAGILQILKIFSLQIWFEFWEDRSCKAEWRDSRFIAFQWKHTIYGEVGIR